FVIQLIMETAGNIHAVPPAVFRFFIQLAEQPAAVMIILVDNQNAFLILQYTRGTHPCRAGTDNDHSIIVHFRRLLSRDWAEHPVYPHACSFEAASDMHLHSACRRRLPGIQSSGRYYSTALSEHRH